MPLNSDLFGFNIFTVGRHSVVKSQIYHRQTQCVSIWTNQEHLQLSRQTEAAEGLDAKGINVFAQ